MNISQLKLSQLKYFLDVAETGSFTKAGDKNFTSQSNISYAIRELEKSLKLPLFVRKNNELSMTRYGLEFLPYVKKAFSELQGGCDALSQMTNPGSGKVCLAFSYIFSLGPMPDILRYILLRSARENRQIDLQTFMVNKGYDHQIVEDVLIDGSADIGLACHNVRDDIEATFVYHREHVLMLPKSHPLADHKKLTLDEVKDEPFVFVTGENESTVEWYKDLFTAQGLTASNIKPSMDWLSIFLEISAGRCLTIAPRCDTSSYDIVQVELDHPGRNRPMYVEWPTNRRLSQAGTYVKQLIVEYFETGGAV